LDNILSNRTIENAIADILAAIGEDLERPGLRDTPRRVAEMYRELFSGLGRDPLEELSITFEEGHHDLVVLKDIPFYSICEHHLVPFFGAAHVAYLPNGRVVGISNIVRALEVLARRPQLQERLTAQLADALSTAFYVMGTERTSAFCREHPWVESVVLGADGEVAGRVLPAPARGQP
jgi:GTP cyclohydrolase I